LESWLDKRNENDFYLVFKMILA